MEQNNQSKSTVHVVTAVKEGYEYAVGQEALKRVGNLPADKLKGVVHEVMYKDRFNLKNLLSGKRAEFSTSTQAVRDDLLIKEDLLEKVKGLIEKWQQGVKVFEDCRVSAKS